RPFSAYHWCRYASSLGVVSPRRNLNASCWISCSVIDVPVSLYIETVDGYKPLTEVYFCDFPDAGYMLHWNINCQLCIDQEREKNNIKKGELLSSYCSPHTPKPDIAHARIRRTFHAPGYPISGTVGIIA